MAPQVFPGFRTESTVHSRPQTLRRKKTLHADKEFLSFRFLTESDVKTTTNLWNAEKVATQ